MALSGPGLLLPVMPGVNKRPVAGLPVTDGLVADLWATSLALAGGAAVGSWPGSSGTGRDGTQGTAASKPTYRAAGINGQPSVEFDGTNDWMDLGASALISTTAGSAFTVLWAAHHTSAGFVLARDHDTNGREFAIGATGATQGPHLETAGGGGLGGVAHSNVPHVFAVTFNNGPETARLDGTQVEAGVGAVAGSLATTSFSVGRRNYTGAESYVAMQLGRLIVYNRVLTTEEFEAIEVDTLQAEYGTP